MKNTMKKILCALLILTICITCTSSIVASAANPAKIPDDAVEFNGHYYKVYDDVAESWKKAQTYCEDLGGHLATITSQEENDFLFAYIIDNGYKNAYFGFSDHETEGTWKWVTGEKVSYTNWAENEPNNQQSSEGYGMFYYQYPDGKWNDGDFGQETLNDDLSFICEWDTVSDSEDSIFIVILVSIWEFLVSIFMFFFGFLF